MYKLTNTSIIIRTADNAFIPVDPGNTDYAAYLEWVAAGNTPDPADPPPVVIPQSVTPLQARRALLVANLLTQVTTAVAAGSQETQLAWEFANSVDRNSEFTKTLAAALSLTDAQVDALFVSAATFI